MLEVCRKALKQLTPWTILSAISAACRHVQDEECNHICCAVFRLLQTVMLACVSLIQGRILAMMILQIIQIVVYLDMELDRYLLPPEVSSYIWQLLPGIPIVAATKMMSPDARWIMEADSRSPGSIKGSRRFVRDFSHGWDLEWWRLT